MTDMIKRTPRPTLLDSVGSSAYHVEIDKSKRGATVQVFGVIGVGELSHERIVLVSHGGRLTVKGRGLVLGILGRGTAEVFGRVEGVELSYGKN